MPIMATCLFRVRHDTKYDVNAMRPIFKDGYVFISSNYRTGSVMYKLNLDGDRVWPRKSGKTRHWITITAV